MLRPTGSTRFRNRRAQCTRALQPRALGFLNRVDPSVSASNYYLWLSCQRGPLRWLAVRLVLCTHVADFRHQTCRKVSDFIVSYSAFFLSTQSSSFITSITHKLSQECHGRQLNTVVNGHFSFLFNGCNSRMVQPISLVLLGNLSQCTTHTCSSQPHNSLLIPWNAIF